MEKFLFVLLAIAATAVVATSRPVMWLLCQFSPRVKEHQLNRHSGAPELKTARVYWYNAVMRDWEPTMPITESQLFTFSSKLSDLLVLEYLRTGDYPDIGVFYHAPHNYGVHPLLVQAAQAAGMPTGDILQACLPAVQMRITSEEIRLKQISDESWTLFWRSGDEYTVLRNAGCSHRPRRAVA